MFNIGFTELLVLGVIGLLVLGPEQLPHVARKLAQIMNELKRAKDEIMSPVEDLKADAQRFIEKARETAAQKELDELLNRTLEPHAGDAVAPDLPPPTPSEPVQQELALDESAQINSRTEKKSDEH